MKSTPISRWLRSIFCLCADSSMVLSSQKLSVALCCQHRKVQSLRLGMKSANFLLSFTNSGFSPYSLFTHRRVPCLLTLPLCYFSLVPAPLPLSWCCRSSVNLPSSTYLVTWPWKSSLSARPNSSLHLKQCFSNSVWGKASFLASSFFHFLF